MVKARVVALDDETTGVRSSIFADDGGTMALKTRTDRNGIASFSVARCDDTLGLQARPDFPYMRSPRVDCAAIITLRVGTGSLGAALAPALTDAARPAPRPEPDPIEAATSNYILDAMAKLRDLLPGTAYDQIEPPSTAPGPREALQQALAEGDDAAAARAAAALAGAPPDADAALARSYDALASAAAFRALGLEPGDPDRPLVSPSADGGATITPAGRAAVETFQSEQGPPVSGAWTRDTLAALP